MKKTILLLIILIMPLVSFAEEAVDFESLEHVPNSQLGSNPGGRYKDKISGHEYYVKFYSNEKQSRTEFLANNIYSLFKIGTLESFLGFVKDSSNNKSFGIITKWENDLKSLYELSSKEKGEAEDQLAKAHIISALIANWDAGCNNNILIRNNKIYVVDSGGSFKFRAMGMTKKYGPTMDDFESLLDPTINAQSANLFSSPFIKYTLKNADKIIKWLDECWDEEVIKELIKKSSLEDDIFENLKFRFKELKIRLYNIKEGKYKLYDFDYALIKMKKDLEKGKKRDVIEDISYKKIKGLPKISNQVVLCQNDSAAWLELENFESLVNGKESNQLVLVHIGKLKGKKIGEDFVFKQRNVKRTPIYLLDPEAAFVFQDKIIRYWNQDDVKQLSLKKAISLGFDAIAYHFGADIDKQSCLPKRSLSKLIEKRMDEYQKNQKESNKLTTIEFIKKREKLGFIAYHTNPIYLCKMFEYTRPKNMSYHAFSRYARMELFYESIGIACEPEILSRFGDTTPKGIDKYLDIFKRIYSEDKDGRYKFSDFKPISAHVFRGDHRSLEDVINNGGFWARPHFCRNESDYSTCDYYDVRNNLTEAMEMDNLWKLGSDSFYSYSHGTAYVATSRKFGATKNFGENVYALFAEGGIELPFIVGGKDIGDIFYKEIAIPVGIDIKNVLGTRKSDGGHMVGPVFLREGFERDDPENFWEILNLFGGKPQCANKERRLDIMEKCKSIFSDDYEASASKPEQCKDSFLISGLNQKTAEEVCSAILKDFTEDEGMNTSGALSVDGKTICFDVLRDALGPDGAEMRR